MSGAGEGSSGGDGRQESKGAGLSVTVTQSQPADRLRVRFPAAVREAGEDKGMPTLVIEAEPAAEVLRFLRADPQLRFDFLADLTAVDYAQLERRERFEVVYHLYSSPFKRRLRVKVPLAGDSPVLATVVGIWPAAGWLERETYDMFGIGFQGHPDLRRILLPVDFVHHPLRKDYPLRGRGERGETKAGTPPEALLLSATPAGKEAPILPEDPGFADLEAWLAERGAALPGDAEREEEAQIAVLNLGPQHPTTRGSLRMVLEIEGEKVLRATPDPGYAHAGFEKLGENHTYTQHVPVADRMNELAPFGSSLAFVLAAEKLMGLEVPRRGQYIRVVLNELSRIAAHLAWVGEQALEAGSQAAFACAFEQRERLCDLFEAVSGARTMTGFVRIGGVAEDLPASFAGAMEGFLKGLRRALDEIHSLLTHNRVWVERARGVGTISAAAGIAWGLSGPVLRGAGVARDVRQDQPYSAYEDFDFEVVVGSAGDAYDRYLVRLEEVGQSGRIAAQALRQLPDGPCCVEDAKVSPPPKSEVETRVEALIHHFKLWMDGHGLRAPAGEEVYLPTETPGGELGYYLVSDGTDRPCRMRVRTPSFMHYQVLPRLLEGLTLADVGIVLGSLNIAAGEVDR